MLIFYEKQIICVYYKHSNVDLTENDVRNITRARYSFSGPSVTNIFKTLITESISLVIYNNITDQEKHILTKNRIKFVENSDAKIRQCILNILDIEEEPDEKIIKIKNKTISK